MNKIQNQHRNFFLEKTNDTKKLVFMKGNRNQYDVFKIYSVGIIYL